MNRKTTPPIQATSGRPNGSRGIIENRLTEDGGFGGGSTCSDTTEPGAEGKARW